ncbi:rRNA maturation RNase YbeY ['Fragaria x ananassa' phyllody phytoplasma]|uniref:Endoribonuclease YbeY n=1 Tax='Fragaria x ananassa' phyllody phytoplasma TaxID=2358428 RepID=A0ABS5K2V6_9MOLU|nr:rRNA maturation RNase YbeY ['Fragaria x ananassa' phyllody phytoplasma]MBS2126217.1 rRNA maturation RNase YbeY ['Fragaria x ananassa' phyllody phytoplasma]
MKIKIHNQTSFNIDIYQQLLIQLFFTIEETRQMHLIFVNSDTMQQLNLFYRQKNTITDVLSFPNNISNYHHLEAKAQNNSLGDIFICWEQAQKQADNLGNSLEKEIAFLAVHGFLHLKGYQHRNPEELQKMVDLQEQILQKSNLTRSTIIKA